jgi:branched-chain amino acid transport system substrate-binding protein
MTSRHERVNVMSRFLAIVTLAIMSIIPSTTLRAADPEPIIINGIEALTGPVAFSGAAHVKTAQILESVVNKQGGIRGRPIKFVFADDESNTAVAVQLVSRLISQKVPYFMGTSWTATCMASLPLVRDNGPLMLCPSPGLVAPAGSYGIAAGPTVDDAMLVLVRYFRERGWTRIALLASTDASGQAYARGVQTAVGLLENRSVQIVADERMNPTDISVAGQLARIKASNPQALLTLATGAPWNTMMRGVNDAGISIPIGGGHGNITYSQLAADKAFLPAEVYFPGLVSLVEGAVGPGPIRNAQAIYFRAFKEAGVKPDLAYNAPWDPLMILMDALRKIGPDASAKQVHDYFMNLHGWVGINGVYDFRDGSQRGVGAQALAVVRYDNAKGELFAASRAAGYQAK